MLREGGHAVDAAVAVGFALAVTWPEAGNIGGGGFMLVRSREGQARVVDYREMAPAKAHPKLFLDKDGKIDPFGVRLGALPAGIPGTIAGFAKAHSLYGRLPWKRLLQPAIALARDGISVDARIATPLRQRQQEMIQFPGTARVFYPGGKALKTGDRLVQPDLARVLSTVADEGAQAFYSGSLAKGMVASNQKAGGIWSQADLANYKAVVRSPIRFQYRGYTILSVPPPSSGGVALGQMLGILEGFDLGSVQPHGSEYFHLLSEAMRRAFLQRALYLGDADQVDVEIKALLSKERIDSLRSGIDREWASKSHEIAPKGLISEPGKIDGSTTHYGVIDSDGNAVSNTYTIEESWGSKMVLDGYGFLLNNEMHDFNVNPGETNTKGRIGTPPNLIAPGKRPLSSQSPTIIERHGKLFAVVGSPGGR
jgi:gamma-glutamyltranspeptidase/glutathione hydrolase